MIDFKIKVTPEQSEIVQNTLQKLGVKWPLQDKFMVRHLDKTGLHISNNFIYWSYGGDFEDDPAFELSFEDFVNEYCIGEKLKLIWAEKH